MVQKPKHEVECKATGIAIVSPFKQRDGIDIGFLLLFTFLW